MNTGRGGVVCVGDSIVNADKSWGFWVAEAGGWPLVRHSKGGATSTQTLEQLGLLPSGASVGAVTVGTNDVLFDWHPTRFESNVEHILRATAASCDRVLIATIPLSLMRFPGSPRSRREKVAKANAIIARVAAKVDRCQAVDVSDLAGRRLMSVDRVHPSAAGQIVIADRAAEAIEMPVLPSTLAAETPLGGRLAYVAGTLNRTARELVKRVVRPELRDAA